MSTVPGRAGAPEGPAARTVPDVGAGASSCRSSRGPAPFSGPSPTKAAAPGDSTATAAPSGNVPCVPGGTACRLFRPLPAGQSVTPLLRRNFAGLTAEP